MLQKFGKEAYDLKFEKYFDLVDDTFALNPQTMAISQNGKYIFYRHGTYTINSQHTFINSQSKVILSISGIIQACFSSDSKFLLFSERSNENKTYLCLLNCEEEQLVWKKEFNSGEFEKDSIFQIQFSYLNEFAIISTRFQRYFQISLDGTHKEMVLKQYQPMKYFDQLKFLDGESFIIGKIDQTQREKKYSYYFIYKQNRLIFSWKSVASKNQRFEIQNKFLIVLRDTYRFSLKLATTGKLIRSLLILQEESLNFIYYNNVFYQLGLLNVLKYDLSQGKKIQTNCQMPKKHQNELDHLRKDQNIIRVHTFDEGFVRRLEFFKLNQYYQ
ncbi:unnamed protein product (macronuclear) [Paramecium tetraurelia]|uniref:Uncharacterized protein n=1 Tax=Paramecium tetraurelia TaxID=5888 RepID=A0D6W9_PARTE|nr:uncharacterized protein GSPATT00001827001 [Paramecium tetraurelia]CAK78786.1 unnamed protein product [Paramecium tetraurelia]|eukprot:XP_001446183.1 hypothetical protein (macronuclear) [Paramecium tetraurelia strain d4-2]